MQQFILRRLLYSIITLWLLTMIVFAVVRFTDDPALLMSDYPGVRAEDLAALRTQWGLDKPYITQYWKFISNVVQGNSADRFSSTCRYETSTSDACPTRCSSPVLAS